MSFLEHCPLSPMAMGMLMGLTQYTKRVMTKRLYTSRVSAKASSAALTRTLADLGEQLVNSIPVDEEYGSCYLPSIGGYGLKPLRRDLLLDVLGSLLHENRAISISMRVNRQHIELISSRLGQTLTHLTLSNVRRFDSASLIALKQCVHLRELRLSCTLTDNQDLLNSLERVLPFGEMVWHEMRVISIDMEKDYGDRSMTRDKVMAALVAACTNLVSLTANTSSAMVTQAAPSTLESLFLSPTQPQPWRRERQPPPPKIDLSHLHNLKHLRADCSFADLKPCAGSLCWFSTSLAFRRQPNDPDVQFPMMKHLIAPSMDLHLLQSMPCLQTLYLSEPLVFTEVDRIRVPTLRRLHLRVWDNAAIDRDDGRITTGQIVNLVTSMPDLTCLAFTSSKSNADEIVSENASRSLSELILPDFSIDGLAKLCMSHPSAQLGYRADEVLGTPSERLALKVAPAPINPIVTELLKKLRVLKPSQPLPPVVVRYITTHSLEPAKPPTPTRSKLQRIRMWDGSEPLDE